MPWQIASPSLPPPVLGNRPVTSGTSRRGALRAGFWAGLGLAVCSATYAFGRFVLPRSARIDGWQLRVAPEEVPKPGDPPRYFSEGTCYLVHLQPGEGTFDGDNPALRPAGAERGGVLALYHACTHLGCHLPWRPQFAFDGQEGWFRCPCHGATYTKAGVRVFGPAPRDMDRRHFRVAADGAVLIDVSMVERGQCRSGGGC